MKTISVFIAGAKNLQPLRLRLKALANDLNNEFKQKGLNTSVNMVSYENFGDEQSVYNKFIKEEADMVLFLLDDRMGQKTEEEYKLAVTCHEKNKHPEYCLFLREHEENTEELTHIEEVMRSTSNKYYVTYSNPDELIGKVKSRILELADKKNGFLSAPSKRKSKTCRLLTVFCIVVALLFAVRFALGPTKTSFVYFEFEFPNSLMQNGINDTYVQQHLLLSVQEEAIEAQKKLDLILNNPNAKDPTWTLAFPKNIKAGRYNRLRSALRGLFGCHDIRVNLHFIESGDVITNKLFVTDWNDKVYPYATEFTSMEDGIATTLRNDAAYLSFPFNPIVSVLYDYHFIDELLVYQMVSPWTNEVFAPLDREVILKEYAESGFANASVANLLLGNYYESVGLENGFDKASLKKAVEYYTPLLADPVIGGMMQEKIDYLNSTVNSSNDAEETSLVEDLERSGAIKTDDCRQLIIIGDEETLLVNSKQVYNATLYSFEKDPSGVWKTVFPPFVVHLGIRGFVSPEEKREGDLKTPTGYYALPFAFGKKNDLNTRFEFVEIGKNHVWVSDTTSSEYNRIVVDNEGQYMNNKANELLYRNDHLYDYAIVVDYNTDPVVVGKGSGIFMHIKRAENHGTAGCVAMTNEEIVKLIEWLDSSKKPHVYFTKNIKE